jgi:hypothetical protein
VSEFVVVDDDLMPIRGFHFSIRSDDLQIMTSTIGAQYIDEIFALEWYSVTAIMRIIEELRGEGIEWSRMRALVELADRRLRADRYQISD